MLGQVPQRLLLRLGVQVLQTVDGLDDGADVEARLGTEAVPHNRRRVEHDGLDHQDERHPLVVADVRLLQVVGTWYLVLPRQVVRVGYPTDVVCVFDV